MATNGGVGGDVAGGLEAAGGVVVDANGEPLRYGKTELGLRNPSFIAWGLRDASDER